MMGNTVSSIRGEYWLLVRAPQVGRLIGVFYLIWYNMVKVQLKEASPIPGT